VPGQNRGNFGCIDQVAPTIAKELRGRRIARESGEEALERLREQSCPGPVLHHLIGILGQKGQQFGALSGDQ
jgi:hypothetical protein